MEFLELGKSGEKIPVLGQGTWKLGLDREKEEEALLAGIENGMTLIDTAEMYGTEDIVGEAARGREGLFIATKVSPSHFHYADVIKSCNASLERLGIGCIDLYQLHWPNSSVRIKETMEAMEKLVEDGKIRHIGVSNFSVREMEEAMGVMKRNEIASNQIEYSVISRRAEKEGITDFCRKNRITVIAYSPLGRGSVLSMKGDGLNAALEEIGGAHGKSRAQVALNWLVSKGNTVAIPKAGSMSHAIENSGGAGWRMEREEEERIDGFL